MKERQNGSDQKNHFDQQVALVRFPHVHRIDVGKEPVRELRILNSYKYI